jgi:glycerophosphoryl diester phosphodiesterase
LETDITSTKDGKLICFHDLILDATTNIANHTEFKDRVRTYEVQGANVTGFFTGNKYYVGYGLQIYAQITLIHKVDKPKVLYSLYITCCISSDV